MKINFRNILIKIFAFLSNIFWPVANILAAALLATFLYQIGSEYLKQSESAIADGKQVIIDVATNEITIRAVEERQVDVSEGILSESGDGFEPVVQKKKGKSTLGVIITGLGLDKNVTEAAFRMPEEVALGFSPYAEAVNKLVESAYSFGHEPFLNIPMQTYEYPFDDPGPLAIMTNLSKAKNMFRLKAVLSAAEGYVGVIASPKEKVTHSLVNILPVIDEIKKQNAIFVYNEKVSNQFLKQEAFSIGLPVITNYTIIDEELTKEQLSKKLEKIKTMVVNEGLDVIIVGHAYPLTIQVVSNWVQGLKQEGVDIAPISKFIKN